MLQLGGTLMCVLVLRLPHKSTDCDATSDLSCKGLQDSRTRTVRSQDVKLFGKPSCMITNV